MAIKEVILNFSQLLSHFGLTIHPETVRLCKFNDTKALSNIQSTLIDIVNFISLQTRKSPSLIHETKDLIDVARLIGFAQWSSIPESSYACLLLLVHLIEKIKLLPLLEQTIFTKLRKVLNYQLQRSKNTEYESHSNDQDIYEAMLSNYYRHKKLERGSRELSVSYGMIDRSTCGVIPTLGLLGGVTPLDIAALNQRDISEELREINEITTITEQLDKFRTDYTTFTRWVSSVSYNLAQEEDCQQSRLLCGIVERFAQIEVAMGSGKAEHGEVLYVYNPDGEASVPQQTVLMEQTLQDLEEKIALQKEVMSRIIEQCQNT